MKLKRPSGLSRYASPAFLGVVGIILATGTLSACGSSVESNNTTGAKPGDGLPCDVTKVLQDRCWSCHGVTPVAGAPISLATYEDLTGPAKSDASKTAAQVSVERMKSTTAPMPPGTGAPDDAAVIEAWITAGMPKGTCGAVTDPFGGPVVCTSNQTWTLGDDVADPLRPLMNPGQACNECHQKELIDLPPVFSAAGTVYPTGHEPNNCIGVTGADITDMIVRVTDSMNNSYDLPVNESGNFMLFPDVGDFIPPYTAKVISPNGERAMATPQMSGDCNGCHTESGAGNPAPPGRIVAP